MGARTMPRHRNVDKNAPPAAAFAPWLDAGAAAEQDAPVAWPALARHMGKDKVGDKSGGQGGGQGNEPGPRLSREGAARRAARLERSAGALRDNLRKRKAQARARAENESRARADNKPRGPAGD